MDSITLHISLSLLEVESRKTGWQWDVKKMRGNLFSKLFNYSSNYPCSKPIVEIRRSQELKDNWKAESGVIGNGKLD